MDSRGAQAPFHDFAETLDLVGRTASKLEKADLLARYFHTLGDEDLRTAAIFLTGAAFPAGDPRKLTVGWSALVYVVQTLTGKNDAWLHDAYLRHGDLGDVAAEAFATRRPARPALPPLTLAGVREAFERIAAASGKGSRGAKTAALSDLLAAASPLEAKYLVRIITTDLRVGLKAGLLEEAIAAAFAPPGAAGKPNRRGLLPLVRQANMLISHVGDVAVMARQGHLAEARLQLHRPFHFMLAETIFAPEEAFTPLRGDGSAPALLVEDKYDGIRAQVHLAGGRLAIYSRTLDDISGSFPDLHDDLRALGHQYIIDGEILAWRGEQALAFSLLQQRLRRKDPGRLIEQIPVTLMVFDLLHLDGEELLDRPLRERRERMERLALRGRVRPSLATIAVDPADLGRRFREARNRGNEGLVVKRLDSPYQPGRRGRLWVKLKEELATLDVVVVSVEWGHGKRAKVLSDVTFAVRDGDRLATVGKAYSGLTDKEIAEMTRWFLEHTIRDLGRVKVVRPEIVLEVAFDAVMVSDRHDSGFALRFPRIKRWRTDKSADEINTLDEVRHIYDRQIVKPASDEVAPLGAGGS
ncbi:MAG TPA: ATP-dependent DNA ligase [bacterium]|jgi:DNA ligase-1|nr:ATP-dependent DNA ligase [bacterium]